MLGQCNAFVCIHVLVLRFTCILHCDCSKWTELSSMGGGLICQTMYTHTHTHTHTHRYRRQNLLPWAEGLAHQTMYTQSHIRDHHKMMGISHQPVMP